MKGVLNKKRSLSEVYVSPLHHPNIEKGIYSFVTPRGLLTPDQFSWDSRGFVNVPIGGKDPDRYRGFRSSRKWEILEQTADVFTISRGGVYNDMREVWYCFGYRMELEFFDENALATIFGPMEKDAAISRELAIGRLVRILYLSEWEVSVIGDLDIIDIRKAAGRDMNARAKELLTIALTHYDIETQKHKNHGFAV